MILSAGLFCGASFYKRQEKIIQRKEKEEEKGERN
jgi:hypothetical protein